MGDGDRYIHTENSELLALSAGSESAKTMCVCDIWIENLNIGTIAEIYNFRLGVHERSVSGE